MRTWEDYIPWIWMLIALFAACFISGKHYGYINQTNQNIIKVEFLKNIEPTYKELFLGIPDKFIWKNRLCNREWEAEHIELLYEFYYTFCLEQDAGHDTQ